MTLNTVRNSIWSCRDQMERNYEVVLLGKEDRLGKGRELKPEWLVISGYWSLFWSFRMDWKWTGRGQEKVRTASSCETRTC